MEKKFQRKMFRVTNHFQRWFLYPIIISFFIGCAIAWLSLVYFYVMNIPISSEVFDRFKQTIPLFLVVFCFLMFCVLLWTCYVSNKIFGPYQRIIRDFFEVLQKKRKGPLIVRKGDKMFDELLKRINALIE